MRTDQTAVCWGGNAANGRNSPPSEQFSELAVGAYHGCGLKTDGAPVSWGSSSYNQASPL